MWFALKDQLLQVDNENVRCISVRESDHGYYIYIGRDINVDENDLKISADSRAEADAIFEKICLDISKNRKFIDLRDVEDNG